MPADPRSGDWEGHHWSEWATLDIATAPDAALAPNQPGLYRIRCRGEPGLIYIGQTGSSLRGRFRQLRKSMEYSAAGRPAEAPHIAGACVQAHLEQGRVVAVSWVALPGVGKRARLGLEVDLIAAYRRVMGESPTCEFAGTL
jgi:hypothetical protein